MSAFLLIPRNADIIDDRRNYFLAGQQQGLDMASIVELVVVNVFKKFEVLVSFLFRD